MKKLFLIVLLFAATHIIALPSSFAAKNEKRLIIGANLNKYSQPARKNCDVKVPLEYSTIQAGIDAAGTGDIVCVGKGIYNEDITINKSITLAGNGDKHQSVVNGQTPGWAAAITISADNVIVGGFEINGVGQDYTNSALHIGEFISNVTVRHNHIVAGNGGLALLTDGGQNNQLIQNNILEGNNSPQVALVNGQPTVGKPSDKVNFLNNTFTGTVNPTTRQDTGVVLAQGATNSSVKYNVFNTSGTVNEVFQNAYASEIAGVSYNNFDSDALLWKVSNGVGVLNAENNWWGDTDPSDDVRNDMVDFTPFALEPFKEY